jgi:hypothetical protein
VAGISPFERENACGAASIGWQPKLLRAAFIDHTIRRPGRILASMDDVIPANGHNLFPIYEQEGAISRDRRPFRQYSDGPRIGAKRTKPQTGEYVMSQDTSLSLTELNDRIAILLSNIRQLVEQGAGPAGGATEERVADRISQQSEELERLTGERDALLSQ